MILGFVTDHFLSVVVISSVRNLRCVCCDSAVMSGEGGGLRQGERVGGGGKGRGWGVEARGEGETGVISVLKLSVGYVCFA